MVVKVQRFPVMSSPFDSFLNFEREIDDLFGDFLSAPSTSAVRTYPAIDIAEYDNDTVVVAEMPGVQKEDLKLTVQDGLLVISGERKIHQLPENASWLRNEISAGQFTRTIRLPHEVQVEKIGAELTNGVLRVTLPKAEQVKPREIKVN